jgi:hypothetical protein
MMGKMEFIIQYVLNRALTVDDDLEGVISAKEAIKAWNIIEEEYQKTPKTCIEYYKKEE